MIEIIQMIYAYTPSELKIIISGIIIGGIYLYFKDFKK
jgi:hypothetical protein